MWLIVQESALEEGSLDVFVFFLLYGGDGGGVLGGLRPLWTEGERTPSEAGPVSWHVGGRSTGVCGGSDSAARTQECTS